MKEQIKEIAIGLTGIVGTELTTVVNPITPEDIGTIGNLLIQIGIAIATIIGLFRRKKS